VTKLLSQCQTGGDTARCAASPLQLEGRAGARLVDAVRLISPTVGTRCLNVITTRVRRSDSPWCPFGAVESGFGHHKTGCGEHRAVCDRRKRCRLGAHDHKRHKGLTLNQRSGFRIPAAPAAQASLNGQAQHRTYRKHERTFLPADGQRNKNDQYLRPMVRMRATWPGYPRPKREISTGPGGGIGDRPTSLTRTTNAWAQPAAG
jgi:hypothetical protein